MKTAAIITPEEMFDLVQKCLPGIKITKDEEKTLVSMLTEFIECEDWRPGNEVCDFLGIQRRHNRTEINDAIHDFLKAGKRKNEDRRNKGR